MNRIGFYLATATRVVLAAEDLLDLDKLAAALGFDLDNGNLDLPVSPRGYRLLNRIPRLPEPVINKLVSRFSTLQRLLEASTDDLDDVDGVSRDVDAHPTPELVPGRARHGAALEQQEGVGGFRKRQELYAMATELARSRRLSRFLYVAENSGEQL